MTGRRIDYAGSVHDEREIEAVIEVLRGGPTALRIAQAIGNLVNRKAEHFPGERCGGQRVFDVVPLLT